MQSSVLKKLRIPLTKLMKKNILNPNDTLKHLKASDADTSPA